MNNAKKILKNTKLAKDVYDAIDGADAMLIITEWQEFREIDLKKAKKLLKTLIIIDGRNLLNPKLVKEEGFTYVGIGR